MDRERQRIQDDLRGVLSGLIRCDEAFVRMYANDASIYQVNPLGVVRPQNLLDVAACVQYAAENDLPLHARGAGTGLAGGALGAGLVLDFSHSMRRVIREDEDTVRVQPGVVLADLNRRLARHNRFFAPDPSTRSVTTIGGVLALNSSGSHWPRYGAAADHLVSLQVVLADGSTVELNQHNWRLPDGSSQRRRLTQRLGEMLHRERETIDAHTPSTCVNTCGYSLHGALHGAPRGETDEQRIDLARLLCGSEGTLGLITEATLKTEPLPAHRGVALLFFERLDAAAKAVLEIADTRYSACDMLDRRLLAMARETSEEYGRLLPAGAEALLLVEYQGDSTEEVSDRLREVRSRLQGRLLGPPLMAWEKEQRDWYWRLIRRIVPVLYRLKGNRRALPFVEDIAVPPQRLPEFLGRLQNTLKRFEVTASVFSHAGHGQLHIRPFLDLLNPAHVRVMQDLASELYEQTQQVGGVISGEHGDGLSRTWAVRKQYGPVYDLFREVKRLFDPQSLFNPGKIVADAPQPLTKNLRPIAARKPLSPGETADSAAPPPKLLEPLAIWSPDELERTARACNGCGRCRTLSPSDRMCPLFRIAPREEATPRSKANLLRAVLTGETEPEQLESDDVKAVADLCIHCCQCRDECPAGVDIPKLAIETKAQYASTNGLPFSEWLLTRPDWLAAWGWRFRTLANFAIGSRWMRWLLEKTAGIAQSRKLPKLAGRPFLRRVPRRYARGPVAEGSKEDLKIVYFVDAYANWFDPALAKAAVAIFEHQGAAVRIPPRQVFSAMPLIAAGALENARPFAARNVGLLADAVRQGYEIVATEPSAVMCLQREYLNLLDDDDARLVAEHSHDACAFLWKLKQEGRLKENFEPLPISVGYHEPCHVRALYPEQQAAKRLLELIPDLEVQSLNKGCSGMAGVYGLQQRNHRNSLRMGIGLIAAMREETLSIGATECSACKLQMEQGGEKAALHPLKLLAMAYGLAPENAKWLTTQPGERTCT